MAQRPGIKSNFAWVGSKRKRNLWYTYETRVPISTIQLLLHLTSLILIFVGLIS